MTNSFKIKTRADLSNTFPTVYSWLLRNNKQLLNGILPDKTQATKQALYTLAKTKADKPSAKNSSIGLALYNYTNVKNKRYDGIFTEKIRGIRPEWFLSRTQKAYHKITKIMPLGVSFKSGQIWKGVTNTYVFICQQYGEFIGVPNSLRMAWKAGHSGHPKSRYSRSVDTHILKSKKTLLKLMPSNVTLKPNQKWKGMSSKYTFVCSRYGEFYRCPLQLKKCWKLGLSGHPKCWGVLKRKPNFIKSVELNHIFYNCASAATHLKIKQKSLNSAMLKGHRYAGHTWLLASEDEVAQAKKEGRFYQ